MAKGGPLHDFAGDVLGVAAARSRPYLMDGFDPVSLIERDTPYGRCLWGLLSLELWQQRVPRPRRRVAGQGARARGALSGRWAGS